MKKQIIMATFVSVLLLLPFAVQAVVAAGSAPVTVVNTPLPVTGTVTASGTVTVGGTVQTQDVDNRTRHAWQGFFAGSENSFTVPAGQRLTIEFASFTCTNPHTDPVFPKFNTSVFTHVNNLGAGHTLLGTYDGTSPDNTDFYSGASLVRIYADPGTTVGVFTGISGSHCSVVLSGYMTQM